MNKKFTEVPFGGETGDEFRRRVARADIEIETTVTPDSYFEHLMDAPTAQRGGSGGAKPRMRKCLLRPLVAYCAGCRRYHTADISVCPSTGYVLGVPERDIVGPPRDAILAPDLAAFLENSKANGLRLRDVIEFSTHEPRFRCGDLAQWADAIQSAKSFDRERDFGDRGGHRLFGRWAGVKVVERLPKSIEATLTSAGVSFERDARLTLTAAANMAVEQYVEHLTLLRRPNGWNIPPSQKVPDLGPVTLLSSTPEECRELSELIQRPDLDAIIGAALSRKRG